MVFARLAEYFSATSPSQSPLLIDTSSNRDESLFGNTASTWKDEKMEQEMEQKEERPPYLHIMLAGGFGGLTGDMLMHSLDTVKTRQQGDPHRPPKYHTLGNTYYTILRQEGVPRGLYGGVTPAAIGSFVGTVAFFGTYEWSKRYMIDIGIAPSIAYLNAGFIADLAASPLYVPSEVLKTRLQLQGRYNNPFFKSGYNYRSTLNAARTIIRTEGYSALYHGFKATLYRDIPFSGLQFLFYETERGLAKRWVGSNDIGLPLEILTGFTAGGMAGTITCPLDVVKTRIQTQVNTPRQPNSASSTKQTPLTSSSSSHSKSNTAQHHQRRTIFTSPPSASVTSSGLLRLDTSSVITGLRLIYKAEGVLGLFRGVGPRALWTSVQTSTMFLLYQAILRVLEEHPLV